MGYVGDNAGESSSSHVMIISKELSIDGGQKSSAEAESTAEKDPRKIARKYQLDLCQKALNGNTIAYLGTGCGKTHIAVLLMYEMRHLIKKPQKNICVFLAPTVALVEQQAKVIEDSIDIKVGIYCGSSRRLKGHRDWEKEMAQHEVFVMTPQILLLNLNHCFMRIEQIALLIFDECHYAQVESNHPYAEIMKVFYLSKVPKLPRIFGMTASPKLGKGGSINSLENLLRAKVYSVVEKDELEQFVNSPEVNIYYYTTATDSTSCPLAIYYEKLEEIKRQCVSMVRKNVDDHTSVRSMKKTLQKLHTNMIFCLENLGLWAAFQATQILLKGDQFESNELMEEEGQRTDDSLCNTYLAQAARVFSSNCMKDGTKPELTCAEVLAEPFFSRKLLRLIDILSNFRLQPNMKCIVFVNRIVTARSLSRILRNVKILSSWRCDFLVGVHSGLKSVSRKSTNIILEKFRSGELNLLVATKVGEEGLDIQTCCLVIRFDLPETVASFIQSRGRARMPLSEYAFLVNSGNEKELNLIRNFRKDEDQMNEEIECRTTTEAFEDLEEKTYEVDSTGARISSGSSVALLHRYCSKLPHDEYFIPKPEFFYFDDLEGSICKIILPSNASIHEIASSPQSSRDIAKKDACLQACKELHLSGALDNNLLPEQDVENEELTQYSSDSDCSDDKDSRRELYEMLVPAALKEPWSNSENSVCLSSYLVKFSPHPADRDYKPFGLFVRVPLPGEAERMRLDLHLARGRSVETELVPHKIMRFEKDEIVMAEMFQEMFLKVIIDRSEFIPEFVSLGKNDYDKSTSRTFYLMLPVVLNEYEDKMTIDWKLVKRCLSSPIFRMAQDTGANGLHQHQSNQLHLANGPKSIDDVANSLVYAPSKDIFFFVSGVLDKDAYSSYKETNYVEHYSEAFRIRLSHPNQPLLKAKQLFCLDNLLRKKGHSESRHKEEHFVELPPEICQLKIIGFSKDIGSSLSLLPSVMHHLESLLVAFELKQRLSASFPEGAEVTVSRVLEALTTEKCNERFSLERLEILGDAFLKFAVGRHLFVLHDALDEGQLTRKRSNTVNNSNLFRLATTKNLQVYIRDHSFEPSQFFLLGRPCPVICRKETEKNFHSSSRFGRVTGGTNEEVRFCSKSHHWLHKKTIADVVESLVGAFIVDSGFKAATAFLNWVGIQVDVDPARVGNICSASTIYMQLAAHIDIAALENLLDYQFVHKGLLVQAFVHPSYNNHSGGCYQRLEFLGDALLDYLITSYLYSTYPKLTPGQLTDLRSMSVNNNCFAGIAINRSFHKFIICNSSGLCKSMDKYIEFTRTSSLDENLVEPPSCPKALGDLVESCIGAILLDTGFDLDRVWKTMCSFLDPVMSFTRLQLSPIRELQELCQSHNLDLDFESSKKGNAYTVEAKFNGKDLSGTACITNHSRKAAKRLAAKQLISTLKEQGYKPKHKMLEDIVRSTRKMEPKLIGYNETPTNCFAPYATGFASMKVQEHSGSVASSSKVHPINVEPKVTKPVKPVVQSPSLCTPSESRLVNEVDADSQNSGGSSKKTAKSGLYEICAANCWKPPVFECCKETGQSHLKEFTFMVVVEVDEEEHLIIEATGMPLARKKDAAESAAEGALWFLKRSNLM